MPNHLKPLPSVTHPLSKSRQARDLQPPICKPTEPLAVEPPLLLPCSPSTPLLATPLVHSKLAFPTPSTMTGSFFFFSLNLAGGGRVDDAEAAPDGGEMTKKMI
ncbi:hypothetical protein TIFTF001_001109 [Ficus carica]|uniref:Uncharacterized protein n=1 Tax=Ficus carica TaxID=3494 RepID=A0AA87ZKI8_FICCA|nr:hypothetical protein TIFTF001_001109 [Ficus carica]